MNTKLVEYIEALQAEQALIPHERIKLLNQLIDYVTKSKSPQLHFICTHNSRRSHLSQIWAQTMADYTKTKIQTFSGGTEATAFHPNAVAAIERAGFVVKNPGGNNPKYEIYHTEGLVPMVCYSKRFDENPNPTNDFAAIMTCSEADAECPVVFGSDVKIKLFYEDPKKGDGTPMERTLYDERCRQIAREMYFVFHAIK